MLRSTYVPEADLVLEKVTPLRHMLSHYIDAVRAFITYDVIETAWNTMLHAVSDVCSAFVVSIIA